MKNGVCGGKNLQYDNYTLAYVDEDDIPELAGCSPYEYQIGTCVEDKAALCYKNKGHGTHSRRWFYLPKQNHIASACTGEGGIGAYEEYYILENGDLEYEMSIGRIPQFDDQAESNGESTLSKRAKDYICSLEGNLSGIAVYDDCSGLVEACLQQAGFEWHSFSSSEDQADETKVHLQAGDILVRVGHVEIFSHLNDDGRGNVYTWGRIYNAEPVRRKAENDIKSQYARVWRLKDD